MHIIGNLVIFKGQAAITRLSPDFFKEVMAVFRATLYIQVVNFDSFLKVWNDFHNWARDLLEKVIAIFFIVAVNVAHLMENSLVVPDYF